MTQISMETLGSYYVDTNGVLWRHLVYSDQPTATLERVSDGERRSGVVGSLILDGFTRLVPEEDA